MSMPYQYPSIYAGNRITANLLTSMEPTFAVVTSALSRPSTIIQTIDPVLQFPVNAGGVYLIEFNVGYSGIIAAGMAVIWSVPSGTSGSRECVGPGSQSNDANADNINGRFGTVSYSSSIGYGCARNSTSLQQNFREASIVTASATGTVGLAWAQVISNASATTVQPGSWGRCTELQ